MYNGLESQIRTSTGLTQPQFLEEGGVGGELNVCLNLYADDAVAFASNQNWVQMCLDLLEKYPERWGLRVKRQRLWCLRGVVTTMIKFMYY